MATVGQAAKIQKLANLAHERGIIDDQMLRNICDGYIDPADMDAAERTLERCVRVKNSLVKKRDNGHLGSNDPELVKLILAGVESSIEDASLAYKLGMAMALQVRIQKGDNSPGDTRSMEEVRTSLKQLAKELDTSMSGYVDALDRYGSALGDFLD